MHDPQIRRSFLYNTTDLATMVWRMQDYHPDQLIYVVDKRQELYFHTGVPLRQKDRAGKTGDRADVLGFGTMNGKDGKPFKTRGRRYASEKLISASMRKCTGRLWITMRQTRRRQRRRQRSGLFPPSNTVICQTRRPRIIFSILTDLHSPFEGNIGPVYPVYHCPDQVYFE